MKKAAISEFKAKLSKYLRLVKSGEKIEILERGIPIAMLVGPENTTKLVTIPARKDPKEIKNFHFSIKPKKLIPLNPPQTDR